MNEPSLFPALLAVVKRDLRLALRRRGDLFNPLLFMLIVISLFPLGVGPDPTKLATIATGVIWVAALLATLLALDAMFRSDVDDGSLEQMIIAPHPLPLIVLAKVVAHWLITGLPLILLSPLLALLLHLKPAAVIPLIQSLALGTPILSLIGAIGVGLTVGLRRGGMLLSLLVLPLYVPVLIFGTSAVEAAAIGIPYHGQLMILGSMLLFFFSLAPLAAAWALRISQS